MNVVIPNTEHRYQWFPAYPNGDTGINRTIYHPNRTGYYFVRITNADGCINELQTNVYFRNTPYARISGRTSYCEGDSVRLSCGDEVYGTTVWTVRGNNSFNASYSDTSKLCMDLDTGTYKVNLRIYNAESQCAGEDSVIVTVHANPPAPSLFFAGNACMGTPPVVIGDRNNTTSQNLYWSNGFYSPVALYYSDGWATAYRMNAMTGCKSGKDSIFILPVPNFDALLTGCYQLCKFTITSRLGMYGFAPFIHDYYSWE